MYLYVYIFLLMSIIGYYTQIFVLRSMEMEANQTTIADVMAVWHDTAYKLAQDNQTAIFSGGVVGCALGKDDAPRASALASCSSAITSMPANLTSGMKFNSIAYRINTTDYVVTYVLDDANGYAKSGFSSNDILQQIRKRGYENSQYGTVLAGTCNAAVGPWLVTNARAGSLNVCYPTTNGGMVFVPNNAVGMITTL